MGISDRSEEQRHIYSVLSAVEDQNSAALSPIAASWCRAHKLHGLLPGDANVQPRLNAADLQHRRTAHGRLISASSPKLDQLYNIVSLAGCGVVLTDREGVVLVDRFKPADEQDFKVGGLLPGADWSERIQGTNGIGTCIAEQKPVAILRQEHFRSRNISMSCYGAPVFDETGELTAVLDVSSIRSEIDDALHALIQNAVTDSALDIEANHFLDAYADYRILHLTPGETRAPVMLAIDPYDIVVGATRAARKRYNLPPGPTIRAVSAADLIGDTASRGTGLKSAEYRELKRALYRNNGNKSAAAKSIGLSRATFYRRAKKHGLVGSNES